jgi:hypothetical protein
MNGTREKARKEMAMKGKSRSQVVGVGDRVAVTIDNTTFVLSVEEAGRLGTQLMQEWEAAMRELDEANDLETRLPCQCEICKD